jgi:hypothetical protein
MTHASWVWDAWVDLAMPGSATFSEAIAATTAASARQTTTVTAPGRTARFPAAGGAGLAGWAARFMVAISCSYAHDLYFRMTLQSF